MKINKRTILVILSFLSIVLIISSCASKSTMSGDSVESNSIGEKGAYFGESPTSPAEVTQSDMASDISGIEPEKVIISVHFFLETTEFDSTIEDLGKIINKNKGYIENSHISNRGNKVFKNAQYVIRIPKNNVDGFTGEIGSVGNIVSQSTSKEDITKQYYDTESRLNLLKTKEERMSALLKKAEKMEDIIAIENQLSEIIHQKESMTKSILDMDDRVSYSIVHMDISEVEKLRGDITAKTTFAAKLSNAFGDSLYTFKVFIEGFVLVLVYTWPFLLVAGVAVFLVFKFIVRRKNK